MVKPPQKSTSTRRYPQGTVLGPLMFQHYVNGIGEGVNPEVKLFADDCLLYRTIESESDTKQLHEDLSKMTEWSKKWLIRFNANKMLCHETQTIKTEHRLY